MLIRQGEWRLLDITGPDAQAAFLAHLVLTATDRYLSVSCPHALTVETGDIEKRGSGFFVPVRYGDTPMFGFSVVNDANTDTFYIDEENSAPEIELLSEWPE